MPLNITPLSPRFGAEIHELDLERDLNDESFAEILAAWRKHQVLLFRDQSVGDSKLLNFAKRFGVLDPAPYFDTKTSSPSGYPEISVVSNVIENGEPIGNLSNYELAWHSDMTYKEDPPVGCILHAWEAPEDEGATWFNSLRNALADLPRDLYDRIKDLKSFHDKRVTSAGTVRHGVEGSFGTFHPFLIRHPSWNEEVLLLGRRTNAVVEGLEAAASDALLDEIWAHVNQPKYTLAHSWKPGDVVIWDNLLTLHRRDAFAASARRILHRAQIRRLHPQFQAVAA